MTDSGKRSGWITAAELDARLAKDPEYQARMAIIRAEAAERKRQYLIAERPVREELQAMGFNIDTVWQLPTRYERYDSALPVLMWHLEKGGYPPKVMHGLTAALSVKPAVVYWDRVKALYLAATEELIEDALAALLASIATKTHLGELVELLSSDRGSSRLFFFTPILRRDRELGLALCEKYQDDPELGKEATAQLRRRRHRKKPDPK